MRAERAVAIGYATIDYVVEVATPFTGRGTVRARQFAAGGWPRPGGAPLYACRQLAAAGFRASPITWLGSDVGAQQYRSACLKYSIDTTGLESQPGGVSSTCLLIYQPDGEYGCVFDPGNCDVSELSSTQISLLAAADLVFVGIGPPGLTKQILETTPTEAIVAWIAKGSESGGATVDDALVRRADYVFCNAGERDMVDHAISRSAAKPNVVVETRGSDGVLVEQRGGSTLLSVKHTETPDTTGAGDTLAGATLAAMLAGRSDPVSAVQSAIRQTRMLLDSRR